MTGQALLEMDGVACRRGGRLLFERLDLRLAAGEAVVVTGPNGVGKSSLLRLAAGLLAPAAGTVRTGGRVAWLGDATALDPELPLAKALRFWARLDGSAPGAVGDALAAVGLAALGDAPVRLLSTGQRRRAALARAVASGAALWLLDEPANGLDAVAVAVLEGLIAAHRQAGGAVVVATHLGLDVARAERIALGGVV
ncbi:heme ABC exporter ATP-binding protein CcmA [uncultured Sphingomonas sp.]|uniref:heme ABC exporter ATP-binding protein CcmA n=1 Tax=uncultured Sphingomonas sp. TaxID=158754 RepID=UPI0035C967C2